MYYNYLIIDEKLKFDYYSIQDNYDKIKNENSNLKNGNIIIINTIENKDLKNSKIIIYN